MDKAFWENYLEDVEGNKFDIGGIAADILKGVSIMVIIAGIGCGLAAIGFSL